MKSRGNATTPDGPGSVRPDVVVGDLDGAACTPRLTECIVEALRGRGYSVKVCDRQAQELGQGGRTSIYRCISKSLLWDGGLGNVCMKKAVPLVPVRLLRR